MFDVCIVGKALSPYRQTFNEVSQEMKGKASLVVVDCGWVVMGVTSLMKFHVQCIWKQKYFNWIVFDGIFFCFQWSQKVVQKHESESSKYRIKTFQVGQVKYSTVED